MAVFRYRMQNVLEVKNKLESQAKQNFATAQRILNEAEEQLRILQERKAQYETIAKSLRTDAINVIKIKENADAIKHLEGLCEEQVGRVNTAKKNAEVARRLMLEARRETKTQEKLRENALEEFFHEENLKESKEIDELTNYRYFHKETGE